jgi:hypothetical protein
MKTLARQAMVIEQSWLLLLVFNPVNPANPVICCCCFCCCLSLLLVGGLATAVAVVVVFVRYCWPLANCHWLPLPWQVILSFAAPGRRVISGWRVRPESRV